MKLPRHLQWVDFLRGLSALGIILFHARVDLWVGWTAIHTEPASYNAFDRTVAWLSVPLPFLGSAVMLFFLISGFCIHYPYAAGGRPLELKSYAGRRFLRIYPPYLAAVLFGIVVECIICHMYGKAPSSMATVVKSLVMVQNFGPNAGQMVSNPSLWSLPVEVELYVAYPAFFWLLTRHGPRWAMGIAAAVSLVALILSLDRQISAVFNITNHFALFWVIWCAGAWLAEKVKSGLADYWTPWMSVGMAASFVLAVACSLWKLPLGLIDLAWALFYFFILFWGLIKGSRLPLLGERIIRKLSPLGIISYSLYLVHFPFFKLCGAIWVAHFGVKPANLFVPMTFCGLAILLALLAYRCIEAPSHRFAQKFSRRKALTDGTSVSESHGSTAIS